MKLTTPVRDIPADEWKVLDGRKSNAKDGYPLFILREYAYLDPDNPATRVIRSSVFPVPELLKLEPIAQYYEWNQLVLHSIEEVALMQEKVNQ